MGLRLVAFVAAVVAEDKVANPDLALKTCGMTEGIVCKEGYYNNVAAEGETAADCCQQKETCGAAVCGVLGFKKIDDPYSVQCTGGRDTCAADKCCTACTEEEKTTNAVCKNETCGTASVTCKDGFFKDWIADDEKCADEATCLATCCSRKSSCADVVCDRGQIPVHAADQQSSQQCSGAPSTCTGCCRLCSDEEKKKADLEWSDKGVQAKYCASSSSTAVAMVGVFAALVMVHM